MIEGSDFADQTLKEIIVTTADDTAKVKIFDNVARAWNHNFYWQSVSPEKQKPSGELAEALTRDFGSVDTAKETQVKASVEQFGTGWGWLVSDNGTLKAIITEDAEVPFTKGQLPLLTVDVWEHAYYLDFQNRRPDRVKAVVADHLDWDFAARNFARA